MRYITFETENAFYSVNIEQVSTYDTESLVNFASESIGEDYIDFYEKESLPRATVINVNWTRFKNMCRQESTIKRTPRPFAVIPYSYLP